MRLSGHAAVFDSWTEINSAFEGHFLERVSRGAFRKTISENRDRIRVLLNHGRDPGLGDRPLGPLEELREETRGLYYAAPLLDGVPEIVVSGLRAGLYGASFRFETIREEFAQKPGRSSWNPQGIPERTLKEVRLHELGPVTWPAYAEATANVRSASEAIELRAVGRVEVLPDRIRSGSGPITVRRLRADGNAHARALLRALERGERVVIDWGIGSDGVRGRVVGRPHTGRVRNYLPTPWGRLGEPTWRLP